MPASSRLREKRFKKRRIYAGKTVDFYADLVRLPSGRIATREYLRHPGAAAVLPFVDPGRIVMVQQYRYAVGKITFEIPAGKLHRGESPVQCLKRELVEETGYRADRIRPLTSFWPSCAINSEVIHIFWADRLEPGPSRPDPDEHIRCVLVPFRQALQWIGSGRIQDAKTIIALSLFALRKRGKIISLQGAG